MSRSELHGIISTLRAYLDYEISLDSDSYEIDEALDDAWSHYRMTQAKKLIAAASPQKEEPAARSQRHSFQQKPTNETNATSKISPALEGNEEYKLWVETGAISSNYLKEKALSLHRPQSGQGNPPPLRSTHAQTSRQVNLDRARKIHEKMLTRRPYGWIEGHWLPPEEPPEGFSKDEQLDLIRTYTSQCHRCGLCRNRRTVVCEDGSPDGQVMFIGEGPGREEDEMGIPFVGRAGKLLSDMIAAMGLDRQRDVYIANVVKCRPEGNRDPHPEEISKCIGFLSRQIDAVTPQVIVTLGKIATNALFPDGEKSIMRARGKWRSLTTPNGLQIPVMPTFHPAYVLRERDQNNRSASAAVWSDLKAVMACLNTP